MNELATIPNPFRDSVVLDAWQSPADVAEIHHAVFQACLEGIASASRGEPDSLLVYGPAGSGKTHLLTRVQRHLAATAREAPDQVLRCVFVYVRLQTTPQLLWQHVRRRLVSDLLRRDQGLTQLQRLVAHQLRAQRIGPHEGLGPRGSVMSMRVLGAEDPDEVSNHLTQITSRLGLSRDLASVLEHLVLSRWIRDASAWLAGDSLPEGVLADLGLGAGVETDREGAARAAVLGLCRLAAETLPIVFCFDQVEALLGSPSDGEAFFRFGRLAADLHDADPNVFLLTCLQSSQLATFQRAVLEADFDRFAKRRAPLEPLRPAEVEGLVLARLEASPALAALRAAHASSRFYPFSTSFVREASRIEPCVPRRVLAEHARKFEEAQRSAPRRVVDEATFLTVQLDDRARRASAEIAPGDLRGALVRGAEVLAGLDRARVVPRDPDRDPPEIDLVLEEAKSRRKVAVSVRDEADGRSLLPRLSALSAHLPRKDGARLVIMRDPRVPLPPRAQKVRSQLADLSKRGALVIEPTVLALAALASLSSLLADAKAGDLASEGETVSTGAVLAWMRGLSARDPARLAPVDQLVGSMFDPGPKPPDEDDARMRLAELLSQSKIVDLDLAARELGQAPDDILALARKTPDSVLVLEGPPAFLLDMAGVVPPVEAPE